MTLFSIKSSKIPKRGQIQVSDSHKRRRKSSQSRTSQLFIKCTRKSRLPRKTCNWASQQTSSLCITSPGSASRWKTWSPKSPTWSRTSRLRKGQAQQLSTSHLTLVQTRTAHERRWWKTVTDVATSHPWTSSTLISTLLQWDAPKWATVRAISPHPETSTPSYRHTRAQATSPTFSRSSLNQFFPPRTPPLAVKARNFWAINWTATS